MERSLIPYRADTHVGAESVLVLAPHPDDEVFGCGGAIMRHLERATPVTVIVLSDGAYGLGDDERRAHLLERRSESVAAARVMGYGTPIFWDYRDREIVYGEQLIRRILDAIEGAHADLVYAPSVFEMHPDHRAAGMAALEAVRRHGAGIRLAQYEVGIPLPPNLLLDISDLAERKMAAMACFVSQNARQRYDLDIAALNRYRSYTLPASVSAAEAYLLLAAENLASDPLRLFQSEHARQSALGLAIDGSDLPLVSVIIRSMDRPTLSDALDSVALQTYPNVEVLVVNAKGEGHRELAAWCGRYPLRMCGNGRGIKRSPAANLGMDSARGTYLIFLDDDDLFDPDHLAVLVEALRGARNFRAAYAGVRVVDQAGATISVYNQDFSGARLMGGNFIPIHAVLFARELVAQGCRFDEALDSYEDWDFWLQLARQTDFLHTAKVTAVYRAQLGESGMSLAVADRLEQQQRARFTVWAKWWPAWTSADFDRLVADFRHQLAAVQGPLERATQAENELRGQLVERDARIALLDQAENELHGQLLERDVRIALLDQAENELHGQLRERDGRIALLGQAASGRDDEIAQRQATIDAILNSTSWRLTAPLRSVGRALGSARRILGYRRDVLDLILRHARPKAAYQLLMRTFTVVRREGLAGIKLRLRALHGNHPSLAASGLEAKPGARIKRHSYLPMASIDIAKYDYFFFDVFDTAVIRLFQRPVDLFEYLSFQAKDPDFHHRRIQQEARTRELSPGRKDIRLAEVYGNLPGAAIDREIAAELKFCVANPEVHAFYETLLAEGKKIYFVSDMYLDKATIAALLEQNGYAHYEDLYVSSEDDLVKGDGSRFDWLKKTLPASAGAAIHIGDNRVADFIQPRAHGFDALHLMESDVYYQYEPFLYSKIEYLDSQRSLGLSFMLGTFRYWKAGFLDQPPSYWRQFGFLYGGALVSAFCGFIHGQLASKALSCHKIYFLARDGDIMSKVYRLLYDDVEPVYLLASRRCMSLPSLQSLTHIDDAGTLRLFTTPLGVASPDDVLDRFCYADLHDLEADLSRIAPDWSDISIRDCILRNKQSIMEKVVAERAVLLDYLAEMGVFEQEDIVIADVGWGGTIQNSLVKLLELGGHKARCLHGFYLGVNENAEHRHHKAGFLFDGDQSQFAAYLNLIELITSSPQDGVIRIDRADGGFVPVVGTVGDHEKRRQAVAAEIQQGIVDFAQIVKARGISDLDFMRPDDFKALFVALQEHASEEDVLHLGQLRHAMTLGNSYGQHILAKQ